LCLVCLVCREDQAEKEKKDKMEKGKKKVGVRAGGKEEEGFWMESPLLLRGEAIALTIAWRSPRLSL